MSKKSSPNSAGEHPFPSYEERALSTLKDAGLRITMPRVQVIRVLAESKTALSAYAIHERVLASGGRMDIVSVYRTLNALVETHLAHHIGIVDGYLACQVSEPHHDGIEHAVCERCGGVEEVHVGSAARNAALVELMGMGFSPKELKIEVRGICASCR